MWGIMRNFSSARNLSLSLSLSPSLPNSLRGEIALFLY
jgi:hypothetical protein